MATCRYCLNNIAIVIPFLFPFPSQLSLFLLFKTILNLLVMSSLPPKLLYNPWLFISLSSPTHSEWPFWNEFTNLRLMGRVQHVFISASDFKSCQYSFESRRTWVTVLNVNCTSWDHSFLSPSHLAKDKEKSIVCFFVNTTVFKLLIWVDHFWEGKIANVNYFSSAVT